MTGIGDVISERINTAVGLTGLCGTILGLALAPDIDRDHPPGALVGFFGTSAQVLAALVVALALFQSGPTPAAGHGARRFLSMWMFPFLGVGLIASVSGLSESLPLWLYRWLFALVVGAGLSVVGATLLIGAGNLQAQREQAVQEQAERLGR
jgi:hypothetical protein